MEAGGAERADVGVGVGGGDGAQEMERMRARVAALEEENDVLALAATHEPELIADVKRLTERVSELEKENRRIMQQLQQAKGGAGGGGGGGGRSGAELSSSLPGEGFIVPEDPAAPFVVPGDRQACVRRVSSTLPSCHGGTNVLCARVCPSAPGIIASGGADKSLLLSRLPTSSGGRGDGGGDGDGDSHGSSSSGAEVLRRLTLAAPVLSMDFCPASSAYFGGGGGVGSGGGGGSGEGGRGLLLAGGMDGGSHLVSVAPPAEGDDVGDDDDGDDSAMDSDKATARRTGVALLASMKNHSKYVIVCRWAPDGSAFATASHDKVVTLYTLRGGGDGTGTGGVGGTGYEQATPLYFPEAVESVEFVSGEGGALELVVSARGQPHLTYVNIKTLQQRQVSLNEKDWDTHVSFTVMAMAASKDGKYLIGATDKSRNILWRAGSNARVRTLMGHCTDDYFQPRVAWDPSGLFSYCNSSADHDVHVHCLASGRIVERLKGHGSVIRDLHHDPSRPVFVTASYDKTVKVWGEW